MSTALRLKIIRRNVVFFSSSILLQVNEPFNPFNGTNNMGFADFEVGKDDCTGRGGKCNGPLKPGSNYK